MGEDLRWTQNLSLLAEVAYVFNCPRSNLSYIRIYIPQMETIFILYSMKSSHRPSFLIRSRLCPAVKSMLSVSQLLIRQYSVFVLLIVILAIVGTVLTLNGSIEVLKEPFLDSLEEYDPEGTSSADQDMVNAWDSVQQDASLR